MPANYYPLPHPHRRQTNNYILSALPDADYERLLPALERVALAPDDILWRRGDLIKHLYFPDDAMISEIVTTLDGSIAEVGVIGREGVAGVDVLLGTDRSFTQRLVQIPGRAIRIKAVAAVSEFKRGEAFQRLVLQYVRLMTAQISQSSVCNSLHPVEKRVARWILMCRDRSDSDEIKLTQELLATMLGIHRGTVSVAVLNLQALGLIKNQRGRITSLGPQRTRRFSLRMLRDGQR